METHQSTFQISYRTDSGPVTRSSNDSILIVAHVGQNCIGDKSFYVTAPRLRNALPRNIREAKSLTVFKKMLKSQHNTDLLCVFICIVFYLCVFI